MTGKRSILHPLALLALVAFLLAGCRHATPDPAGSTPAPAPSAAAERTESAAPPSILERPRRAIYVANSGGATVSVIDVDKREQVGEIEVGLSPMTLLLDEERQRLYVANYGLSSVSIIDLENLRELKRVRVSVMPIGLALVAGGSELWVASLGSDSLTIIDAERLTITGSVTLPPYVSTEAPPTCCVDPLGTLMTIGRGPADLTAGDDPNRLYVPLLGSSEVAIVDVAERKVVALFPVIPGIAQALPVGDELLLGSHGLPDLPSRQLLLTTAEGKVLGGIPTGEMPAFALRTGTADRFWVASHGSHEVQLVDLANRTVVQSITPGRDPRALALDPGGDTLYVSNTEDGTVAFINVAQMVIAATVPVGPAPRGIVYAEAETE